MTELGLLRTRLRAVNMQYSAVLKVRGVAGSSLENGRASG